VQTAPALRDHDGISGILGIVLDRCRNSDAAIVQIHKLAQVGDVLRGLILHAGYVVAIDKKLGCMRLVSVEFNHIKHGAIDESSNAIEQLATLTLLFLGRFLVPRGEIESCEPGNDSGATGYGIKTE
jgi:hypothetical protein